MRRLCLLFAASALVACSRSAEPPAESRPTAADLFADLKDTHPQTAEGWNRPLRAALRGKRRLELRRVWVGEDRGPLIMRFDDPTAVAALIAGLDFTDRGRAPCTCHGAYQLVFTGAGEPVVLTAHHLPFLAWTGGPWGGMGRLTEAASGHLGRWFAGRGWPVFADWLRAGDAGWSVESRAWWVAQWPAAVRPLFAGYDPDEMDYAPERRAALLAGVRTRLGGVVPTAAAALRVLGAGEPYDRGRLRALAWAAVDPLTSSQLAQVYARAGADEMVQAGLIRFALHGRALDAFAPAERDRWLARIARDGARWIGGNIAEALGERMRTAGPKSRRAVVDVIEPKVPGRIVGPAGDMP